MKRTFAVLMCIPCIASFAENYLLNGGQASEIRYEMTQEVVPNSGVLKMALSYVVPKNFSSPSFTQTIRNFDVRFSVTPDGSRKFLDARGNDVYQVEWLNPRDPIKAVIKMLAVNETRLKPLETNASFPLNRIPDDVRVYLRPTRLVPSDNPDVIEKAHQLTSMARTEFDAVQQILSWMIDRVNYVQRPERYDALYSIRTGKGNCQNYSHLSAAFMRAVGIPVRIVNGFTLREPYEIKLKNGVMTMRMAQGRHSWIEVYFSDLGWVPFDPQQMELFISNRFIRVEVGLDNEETVQDGNVRWRRAAGSLQVPFFQELIAADFSRDVVNITGERQSWGPRKLLFSPPVEAGFSQMAFHPEQGAAPSVSFSGSEKQKYEKPDTLGNLEYPESADFLEVREVKREAGADEFALQKNFLVETAEYVTGRGEKYAQTFIADRPMKLKEIGLVLHKFGGNGNLWLELSKDDGTGRPGALIETSDLMSLESMSGKTGYFWHDFVFTKSSPVLEPGRYWIVLAYSGSPVVNWFFTYGKPVGPNDGTRFNTMFDDSWSRSLSYEFNYRVIGMCSK
jgi:hypothetical protein